MKLHTLFLFSIICAQLTASNPLLQKPQPITQEAVAQQASNWNALFTWPLQKPLSCSFAYDKRKAGFALKLFSVPVYWRNYRVLPTLDELKFMTTGHAARYEARLTLKNQSPTTLTKEELMEFIADKKCIFYTGAGISMQGNVAGMQELMQNLHMENGTKEFLKATLTQPEELCLAFQKFCESATDTPPTPAHFAVKALAEKKAAAIITENVDLLHQKTGIEPIPSYANSLAELTANQWQEVEAIICIGLSRDDRGLLAHYKKHNPQGMLVAIDLSTPTYLSDADYVCLGDLQEILS